MNNKTKIVHQIIIFIKMIKMYKSSKNYKINNVLKNVICNYNILLVIIINKVAYRIVEMFQISNIFHICKTMNYFVVNNLIVNIWKIMIRSII